MLVSPAHLPSNAAALSPHGPTQFILYMDTPSARQAQRPAARLVRVAPLMEGFGRDVA
ncbi:hypothetical protein BURKHO8Y_120239 [Burkholderia sp. 8Y]|nr:hypothetical protein BURKHO8Y_120239 [Burkholderia sp. 8Y]